MGESIWLQRTRKRKAFMWENGETFGVSNSKVAKIAFGSVSEATRWMRD